MTQISDLAMSFILKGKVILDINDLTSEGVIGKTKWYEELSERRLKAKKVGDRTVVSIWDLIEWYEALPDYEPGAPHSASAKRVTQMRNKRAKHADAQEIGHVENAPGNE